jgi:hypothetical protein
VDVTFSASLYSPAWIKAVYEQRTQKEKQDAYHNDNEYTDEYLAA